MNRLELVAARARDHGLAALLVTTPANTYYLSQFQAVTYSRPVIVVASEFPVLVVPQLEEEHARAYSTIGEIRTYSDRQASGVGGLSAMHLALGVALEALREGHVAGPIGFESEGLSAEGFYTLRSRTSAPVVPTRGLVEQFRIVKSAAEIDRIREACAVADYGMGIETGASWPGNTELAIAADGDAAMLREGVRRHPDRRLAAGSRPISGPRTALPHAAPSGRVLAVGDAVIHDIWYSVDGYHAEVERTIFIERASDAQRRLFAIMERAAAAALAAVRPGAAARDVDRAARRVIEESGYGPQFLHRTGHGIGLDIHEGPFLGPGDETELRPGMVITIEPGIYVDGVGGFRHSDTVVVTEDGAQVLTRHPREVEALVVRP